MESAVGLWADRSEPFDSETYLRNLRCDHRAERLQPA
jgi:hypothetical protein